MKQNYIKEIILKVLRLNYLKWYMKANWKKGEKSNSLLLGFTDLYFIKLALEEKKSNCKHAEVLMEVFENQPAVQEKTTEKGMVPIEKLSESWPRILAVSRHQTVQTIWF